MNLVNIVQDTSQEIVDLFYLSKNNRDDQSKNEEDDIDPFVTGQGQYQLEREEEPIELT